MSKIYLDIKNDKESIRYIKYYMLLSVSQPESSWGDDDLYYAFANDTTEKLKDSFIINSITDELDNISFIIDEVLKIARDKDKCTEIKEKATKAIFKFKTS